MTCPLCYGDGILDPIIIAQPLTQHLIRYTNLLNEKDEMLRELSFLRDMRDRVTRRKRGGKRRKRKRTLKKKRK